MQIRLTQLEVQFPGMARPLLTIEDRVITSGARLIIRGPSGAGKTTLLHIIAGLLSDYRGQVEVDARNLVGMTEGQRCRWRRERVGLVFQRLNLLGHLTALENVLLGDQRGQVTRQAARHSLDRLALGDRADQLAWNLSLGEQQRVAVARVTARNPLLILADEPTSSLDDATAHTVMRELLSVVQEEGTLVVSTHDTRITSYFSEVWQLESGTVQ